LGEILEKLEEFFGNILISFDAKNNKCRRPNDKLISIAGTLNLSLHKS
jgi:hypothetical protein